jgi:hypothetical protein
MIYQLSLGNFYGIDYLMDLLIVLVAGLVSYQSIRVYLIIKDKNYRVFSWAFLSIAVAYIFEIISNLTSSYTVVITNPNLIEFVTKELVEMRFVHFLSIIFYKTFLLVGFLLLFLIITRTNKKSETVLFIYLSLMTILFSVYLNFIFHLTLIILLIFLTSYFHENYLNTKTRTSYCVFVAFIFMLFGTVASMLSGYSIWVYLSSEVLLLVGFLVLLSNHLKIKNEKKNKAGSNKRSA